MLFGAQTSQFGARFPQKFYKNDFLSLAAWVILVYRELHHDEPGRLNRGGA
tara:strand:- start:65156 stop:65308 length:153 start_codon:yes stop_codon:yes gene_type:complete